MPSKHLHLTNVAHRFTEPNMPHPLVLHNISFKVHEGELVCIVGPSGSGKSTLLRLTAGLLTPTSGEIMSTFTKPSLVFQNFALFPWLTAEQNVEFGIKMQSLPYSDRKRIVREKVLEV